MGTNTPRSRIRFSLLGAVALLAGLADCGGGKSSSDDYPSGTELAFSVAWEQRTPDGGAPVSASMTRGAALGFDTPIPPSVNAIRFTLRPAAPAPACCVAILRGSQAFIDRHLLLADVSEGLGSIEVTGFPTDFAPADGVPALCPTRPADQGVACSGDDDTLPSFGSDQVEVDVLRGVRNVVNVDVYSLPFLINLDPDDGETADESRPHISFTVVDAVHSIDPDVSILVKQGGNGNLAEIEDSKPCLDGDDVLPDCSANGALEVHGLKIFARASQGLEEAQARLRIQASNTANPVRSMESNTVFNVPPSSSTTSTTGEPETFCLLFSVSNTVDLLGVDYDVHYSAGNFTGSGEDVSCTSVLDAAPESETLTSFNDDDDSNTLSTAIVSSDTFSGPTDLARCEFTQVPPLNLGNFSIQVTEATAPDLSPANATVSVQETPCP